jgi:sterol desaturase/sphingolipid hydroxylase (fatty acid hydroxylase superfamily)
MIWLLSLVPTVVTLTVLVLLELRRAEAGDWRINLQAWAIQTGVALALLPLIPAWQAHGLIDAGKLPFGAGLLLFVLVRDLAEYFYHRLQHRIPALWAIHSLHHSDPAMSALTTNRHFWGDQLVKQVTVWSLAGMLVMPTPAMVAVYALISLWNYYVHSALPGDFGRLSWLLNSPDYHRRHHSSLPEHFDSNFAALFPIFDVIAGSYHRPAGRPQTGFDMRPHGVADLVFWPLRQGRAAEDQAIVTTTLPTA